MPGPDKPRLLTACTTRKDTNDDVSAKFGADTYDDKLRISCGVNLLLNIEPSAMGRHSWARGTAPLTRRVNQ